jgi:hypothetical protein
MWMRVWIAVMLNFGSLIPAWAKDASARASCVCMGYVETTNGYDRAMRAKQVGVTAIQVVPYYVSSVHGVCDEKAAPTERASKIDPRIHFNCREFQFAD